MHLDVGLPTLVELTRGGIVETRHRGAVAVTDARGTLVAWYGDPEYLTLPRSALKPFQALPLVESGAADRFGFGADELAIACGSHNGEPGHRAVVARMLERAQVPISALRNGVTPPIGETEHARYTLGLVEPDALFQNCSGKHAGILAACVARGFPLDGYDAVDHPIQREIAEAIATCFRVAPEDLIVGIDGCTLPTFGAPLRNVAAGWAAIADPAGGPAEYRAALGRVADAMAAAPWMVAGAGRLNTLLTEATGGRILSKDGAEGVLCLAIRDRGLGVAFKLEDGTFRAHGVIVHAILAQLEAISAEEDVRLRELFPYAVYANRGQHVGDMRPVFALKRAA